MKALTLIQPWAHVIVHGPKRVENRTWRPPDGVIGQRIAIHAGKKFDNPGAYYIEKRIGITLPRQIIGGAFVGTAVIRGVFLRLDNLKPFDPTQEPWIEGPYCWILNDVRALDEPIPCRGQQGLWTVPEDIAARLR